MSRVDTPPARMTIRPSINVYTGLAFLSFLFTLAACGYTYWVYTVITS